MRGMRNFAVWLTLGLALSLAAEPTLAQRGRGQGAPKKGQPAQAGAARGRLGSPGAAAPPEQTQPGGQVPPGKAFGPRGFAPGAGVPPQFIERLRNLSPEEQEQFLRNNGRFRQLPPERQEEIRRNLRLWNALTPQQREELRERERVWASLSPEERRRIREEIFPKWRELEPERRRALVRRLAALRLLSEAEREAKLKDEDFLRGLNAEDRELLQTLARLRVGPGPEPPPQ
jgi:hypothetical protein